MSSEIKNRLDEIRLLVDNGRLFEAIDSLAEVDVFQEYASLFRARLKDLSSRDTKGVLTREIYLAERNKIIADVLALVSEDANTFEEASEATSYAHLRPVRTEPPFILPKLDIKDFTGRTPEIQQLEETVFGQGKPRIAGIAGLTGTGGMGKSVLAFHFATIHRNRFPDGVIGIRVDDGDTEAIAQRFAFHAGATLPSGQKRSASEIMQSVFRNKQALLIFDNAEDAQVKELRPGGDRCAIIVTTRNKGLLKSLDIAETGRVDLDRFNLEDTIVLLGGLIGEKRVDAEPDAVATIHELVGGLPLAIRIVGGVLDDQPFTSLAEFAELLNNEKQRLRLLRDPDDPELDVEASFAVSFNWLESLDEEELTKAFCCLGACPREGFSLLAAQVVMEQDELVTKALLGRLTRLSLVEIADEGNEFTLHPLLFDFARARAEESDWLTGAEERHTEFFFEYIKEHDEPSVANFAAVEREIKSLLLAARRSENYLPNSTEFYIALEPFLQGHGYWRQALELIESSFEKIQASNDVAALAHLNLQRGQFLQLQGNLESAKTAFEEALECTKSIENVNKRHHIAGMVLNSLGIIYQRFGKFNEAISVFESGLELVEELGDRRAKSMMLNSLGVTYQRQAEFPKAIELLEESKQIAEEDGDQGTLATTLNLLGGVYQRQGRFDDAVAALHQSKQIAEELGNQRNLAMVLNSLASVYHRQGRFDDAVAVLERSREIVEELGDVRSKGMMLNSLGGVYQRQRRFDEAIAVLEESKKISEQFADERSRLMVLNSLGSVYQRQGRFYEAVAAFEEGRQIATSLGDRRSKAMVLTSLGSVYQRLELYEEAVKALKESAELETEFGNMRGLAIVLNSLAGAYRKQNSRESWLQAVSALKESEAIEVKLGNKRGQAMVLTSLGDVYQRLKEFDEAISVLNSAYELEVELGDTKGQAMTLTALGGVYQQKDDLPAAVDAFRQSLAIEEASGDRKGQAMVLCAWGKTLLNHDDHEQAAEKLKASFEIDAPLRNVKGLNILLPALVQALRLSGRSDEAQACVKTALTIAPEEAKFLNLEKQLAENRPVSVRHFVKRGSIKKIVRKPSGYLYGFIIPDDGSPDIYFGEESVSKALLPKLTEGTKVRMQVHQTFRSPRARTVLLDDQPAPTSDADGNGAGNPPSTT
jgi:tetratricopeptide (TPR) repeat protein